MNSIKQISAKSSLMAVIAVLIAFTSFAGTITVAHAEGADFDLGDGGGFDWGSYDVGGYDYGNYDVGGYDYGNYDVGGYDYGNYDVSGYDYGNYDVSGYDYGNYDVSGYDYGNYDVSGYDAYDTYEESYVDTYLEEYYQEQQQMISGFSGGSFGGSSFGGGSFGGFSMPKFSQGGCTTCHSQSYPIPQPPRPTPGCTTCGGSNVTNTNINTNTNTFIDNSINDSFNTNIIDSGNTNITTLAPVVPQPIIQYQQQIAAPYCVITLTNTGAYSAQATLVWSSSNATSAYISQVGAVAPNGQRYVTGYANQIYSLTVTGQGGSYTCQTQQYTPTYVPPAPITPSVSLTQIPYTGLALGPIGNAMYWLSMFSVAAAGAYLLVYYKGGALALAGAALTKRQNHFVVSEQESTEVETPVVEEALSAQAGEKVTTPVAHTFSLPTMASTSTRDAMRMIRNAAGVPSIVISRA